MGSISVSVQVRKMGKQLRRRLVASRSGEEPVRRRLYTGRLLPEDQVPARKEGLVETKSCAGSTGWFTIIWPGETRVQEEAWSGKADCAVFDGARSAATRSN